ncbi:MAG: Spy/CpxP family protein refolding chaperone [Oryzomonas sp.]
MKRQIIMCALLAATAIGVNGVWAGGADDGGQRTMGEDGWGPSGMMMPPPPPEEIIEHMAGQLNLTSDQQTKIKAVFAADREKIPLLVQKVGEYRKQLRDATHAAAFDEAAIRTIATKLAQAEIELIVAGERVRSKVSALLTPEQRVAAEKLPPLFHHGQGPGERPGCGQWPGCMPPPPPCNCWRGPGAGGDGDRIHSPDPGCGEERG